MTKLVIVNPTKHHYQFTFRAPSDLRLHISKLIYRDIPAGHQVTVFEGTESDVLEIADQNAHYGVVRYNDAINARAYTGLFWNDRPVSFDDVKVVNKQNNEALDDAAAEERKKLTAATAIANEELRQQSETKPQSLTVEVNAQGKNNQPNTLVQKLEVKQQN